MSTAILQLPHRENPFTVDQRIFGDGCMFGEFLVDTWALAIE